LPLRAVPLGAQPIALGLDIALSVLARAYDGLEDPFRVAGKRYPDAAAPVDPGRDACTLELDRINRGIRRRRPRSHDQPRLPCRQLRADLLGDMGHHGMQQL